VPAPVPYSLDDAEGIVAASSEAVDALVVDAAFADDDVTEPTDCAVSTGNVPVPVVDAPPAEDVSAPVVVEAATPDERPEAPVLSGAGVVAAALPVVDVEVDVDAVAPMVEALAVAIVPVAVALVSGAALAALEATDPEPPEELVDDDIPADEPPLADVPAALLPVVPALDVPAPAALALPVPVIDAPPVAGEPVDPLDPKPEDAEPDDPAPPVAVVLADAPPNATWIGRFATEVGSKISPRTSICVSRPG
jgi:hypothetical protein